MAPECGDPWSRSVRTHDLERCRSLPLFANMHAETFRHVTAGAHMQRFPPGTMLLLEGDAVDFLYVLLSGQVELHGTWNDQETVLGILRPVSTFILAAVVLDTDALMSARTLENSEILMIPGDAIRSAMWRTPSSVSQYRAIWPAVSGPWSAPSKIRNCATPSRDWRTISSCCAPAIRAWALPSSCAMKSAFSHRCWA